ncbi:erythroblast NAD(P)(+)--arginine ADP-ribosyltransferase-like [Trematomus bernacchii]|uniref:erythroblast NAD(P)(+)--arginine ADP-ribosyltransferase-like n=1 Tax=Trematomus bernacchii TaxID=40690 RepID=UPI00146A4E73|nr:erythroblast NAD(P)(+)--arginine ADP-ribosyltransferase-like [Trematomus bernacchii]
MESNMWIFATLGLLLCWMMPFDSVSRACGSGCFKDQGIPLSMVEDSVDDMYFGCNDKMMTKVKDRFLEEEKSVNNFGEHWSAGESCAKDTFNQREDKALTRDHIRAICVYTANGVYRDFNTAVRTEGRIYPLPFHFKYRSLHYLLTSAIQILNNNDYCHSTFRRTNILFTGKVNQIIRFGSFTSTSFRSDFKVYGTKTCFKIKTCLGASLKKYSAIPTEEEVLIPPYETFKITKICQRVKGLKDCEVIFVLESAGVKSSLNCKALV